MDGESEISFSYFKLYVVVLRNDWYPVSGCTHTIVSHCQIQENIGFFEYSVFWITRSDQSSNISIPNIPDNQIIVYQPLEKSKSF